MNQRVPQSNPDLVELEIANYLPKIGKHYQEKISFICIDKRSLDKNSNQTYMLINNLFDLDFIDVWLTVFLGLPLFLTVISGFSFDF